MEGEYELSFEGYTCPIPLVNDFTPDQFAEMVTTFKRYDADGSQTMGLDEMAKLLEDLDMGHAMEKAAELMALIDADESGELDFSEFCDFFSRLTRGDTALRGFNALAEALNETPVTILEVQAQRRKLLVDFRVVEERTATSMHAAHFVVECTLTGIWYDRDKGGKPSKFVGAKKFQGIGKTTRSAKFKCAQNCLTKLKNAMPGIGMEPGEIPETWLRWAHENLERGVGEGKVLKTLTDKGFSPSMNIGLMQALTVIRHLRQALEDPERGQLLFAGEEVGDVNDELDAFLDARLRLGFDGPVLLQTIQQFGFEVAKAPGLVQRLRKHEVSSGSLWKGAPQTEATTRSDDRARDFFRACREGAVDEVELYILASQNLDARKAVPGCQARSGLHFAAVSGRVRVCKLLLQHHASPNFADATGRTAMHLAASQGHVKTLACLDRFGGDAHLLDTMHNSPLHLACKNAQTKAVAFLTSLEDDYQRRVLTGAISAVPGVLNAEGTFDSRPVTFTDLVSNVFTHFLETKNHPKDFPRFRKDWVYEACLWVHDQFAASQQRFVTAPNQVVAEYVLATKDPDPHSGYYLGARGREVYVKTVETLDLLLVLLTAIFRSSSCHTANKLGRTALHEACFENHVDSHKQVVDLLVNQRASNMELVDGFGKRAFDELVVRRGRPGTPTGLDLREHMIMDRRDDLVQGLLKKRREEEELETQLRQKQTLKEAVVAALELDAEGWAMVRTACRPRFRLDPFMVYEDPDTGTFFHVRRTTEEINGGSLAGSVHGGGGGGGSDEDSDEDGGLSLDGSVSENKKDQDSDDDSDGDGSDDDEEDIAERLAKEKAKLKAKQDAEVAAAAKRVSDSDGSAATAELLRRYSWQRPEEYDVKLRLKTAVESVRNRCTYLRSVGEWDMLREERLGVEWWAHASTSEARWCTPPECSWPALLAASKQKGVLGEGQKWAVLVDPDGNTFYRDRRHLLAAHAPPTSSNTEEEEDLRWERPPDAVRVHLGSVALTSNGDSRVGPAGVGAGARSRSPSPSSPGTGSSSSSSHQGAATVGHAEFDQCTRLVFGSSAVEQNWYTSEGLTESYKREVDSTVKKFAACMPCAKKLLRAVNGVVQKCGGVAKKGDTTQEDRIALELSKAEHPVLGGRGGQCQGLKFVRASKTACLVYRLQGLEPAGAGELAQRNALHEEARQCTEERRRVASRRIEQPCVMAVVPSVFPQTKPLPASPPSPPTPGTPSFRSQFSSSTTPAVSASAQAAQRLYLDRFRAKKLRGWNLCRRRKQSEPLFGWRALHDPEPRPVLVPGDVVRARRKGDLYGWHPAVVKQRRGLHHYDVKFGAKDVQNQTARQDIDDDGFVFWWHLESGTSQWEVPDEVKPFELDRERQQAEARAASRQQARGGGGGGGGGGSPLQAGASEGEGRGRNSVVKRGGSTLGSSFKEGAGGGGGGALVPRLPSTNGTTSFGGSAFESSSVFSASDSFGEAQSQQGLAVLDKDDEAFMPRFTAVLKPCNVPWPWLSGEEWEKDLLVRCGSEARRQDLSGWDEFLDVDTGLLFYRHIERHEEESAARSVQHHFRVRHNRPVLPAWESVAYTFECPLEVRKYLEERSGWAVIRRRGLFKRKVKDDEERNWGEAQDTASGDLFYTEQTGIRGCWSSWENPQSEEDAVKNPANKDDDGGGGGGDAVGGGDGSAVRERDDPTMKQTKLRNGDLVKFRFVESPDWVDSQVIRVREDEDTGERMFDVQAVLNKDLSLKWVPRYAIRLHAETQEQVQQHAEAKNWSLQLSRAREAHARQEARDHHEEAERLRRLRRGAGQQGAVEASSPGGEGAGAGEEGAGAGGGGAGGGGGGDGEDEEMQRQREERGALEKRQRQARELAKAKREDEAQTQAESSVGGGGGFAMLSPSSASISSASFSASMSSSVQKGSKPSFLQLANGGRGDGSGGGGSRGRGGGGAMVASRPGSPSSTFRDPTPYISSDEGTDDEEEGAGGVGGDSGGGDGDGLGEAVQKPPMSEEDAAALAEARLKIRQQKLARELAMLQEKAERKEREGWLAESEDRGTSPRTQRRRVIHRNMHRALMRQKDDKVICRWGCGQWVRAGRQEFLHQRELCSKRILQCVLKCSCRMREEQWLAPYVDAGPSKQQRRASDDQRVANQSDDESDDESDSDGGSGSDEEEGGDNGGGGDGGGGRGQKRGGAAAAAAARGGGATVATSNASLLDYPEVTVQRHHEETACVRRLVSCPRKCGEWVSFEDMKPHVENVCVKRPAPVLQCRLGCGEEFSGGVHKMLQCEEDRFEHETEMCAYRIERCTWKGCAATFPAHQRSEHRRKHITSSGIMVFSVPGTYRYKVPSGCEQVQVQLWGGGGGSGHLVGQSCGDGGGGAFVEALVTVRPGEVLEVAVGGGGQAGVPGTTIVTQDPKNPSASHVEEVLGTAHGGFPGGGHGFSANTQWASGGGGGYSMVERSLPLDQGHECIAVAGGGGGGGCRNGVPGATDKGELAGTKIDSLNGRMGTQEHGGGPGDSGEGTLCEVGSEAGTPWQGGNGASFGGGGGGGFHGGGGGGAAPGIVGGGGGGSSYANHATCTDVVFVQGEGWRGGGWSDPEEEAEKEKESISRASSRGGSRPVTPASLLVSLSAAAPPGGGPKVAKYNCPLATGSHELDKVGGRAGEGGQKDLWECFPGKNGAVRILRPRFYEDFNPNRFKRNYIGGARRQEMLLPIGIPVEEVLKRAEKTHAERLDLLERKARGVA